jgi:alkylation response protein AidB-like acyl-CoA dehydrogenase
LRTLAAGTDATAGPDAAVVKLLWSGWHRALGELAMAVRGAAGTVVSGELDEWQRLFLFSRADTIYGGSDEIQRGTIATRTLGLPRQARR